MSGDLLRGRGLFPPTRSTLSGDSALASPFAPLSFLPHTNGRRGWVCKTSYVPDEPSVEPGGHRGRPSVASACAGLVSAIDSSEVRRLESSAVGWLYPLLSQIISLYALLIA